MFLQIKILSGRIFNSELEFFREGDFMNVKIFYVRHYKEYFKHDAAAKLEEPAALVEYQKAVREGHEKINPHFKDTYEGELYGDTGIDGLKLDFNFGLRLDIPQGNWHVKISDYDNEQIFFDEDISDTRLIASEGYFIYWQVEVFKDGEKVFEHNFDPTGQRILIFMRSSALGDNLALLPHVREFQKKYDCEIFLWIMPEMRELVKNLYPEIQQVENLTYDYYATFYLMAFVGSVLPFPMDGKTVSLDRVGSVALGTETMPSLPQFTPTAERKISEPYVCIGVQASTPAKSWLFPGGWDTVVDYLKSLGYRVLCIDKHKVETDDGYTMQMPEGAEDFTGDIPLIERANMLYYAEFFIGLSSGLSWLANSVGCPVVLISGISQNWYEFYTPYRVANRFVCNGCFNDIRAPIFAVNVCWKYKGTPRELECQKKISSRQVIDAVERLIIENNLQVPVLNS